MSNLIAKQIEEQLSEHKTSEIHKHIHPTEVIEIDPEPSMGVLDDREAIWWKGWKKRLRGVGEDEDSGDEADDEDMDVDYDREVEEVGGDRGQV